MKSQNIMHNEIKIFHKYNLLQKYQKTGNQGLMNILIGFKINIFILINQMQYRFIYLI